VTQSYRSVLALALALAFVARLSEDAASADTELTHFIDMAKIVVEVRLSQTATVVFKTLHIGTAVKQAARGHVTIDVLRSLVHQELEATAIGKATGPPLSSEFIMPVA
jgi:hypothetical protein